MLPYKYVIYYILLHL